MTYSNAQWMRFIFLLPDRHLLPRHRLNRSLGELRGSREPTSVFRLAPNFMADSLNTRPGYTGCDGPAGRLAGRQARPCFPWPPSRARDTIHEFSFNRKVPFMLRSPSLAAHQIEIASCKAICLGSWCWRPPALQRGLGLRSADDFSKPPLQAGRQSGATQSVPQNRASGRTRAP